jgi:hypothetical protein
MLGRRNSYVLNQRRNGVIRGIALMVIYVLYFAWLWFPLINGDGFRIPKDSMMIGIGLKSIIVPLTILVFALSKEVLESVDDSEFVTYLRIAWLKFNLKKYRKAGIKEIMIEQDAQRYFCLYIKFADQKDMFIIRLPNLTPVEEEMKQLKRALKM